MFKRIVLSAAALALLLPDLANAKITGFCGFDGIPAHQTVSKITDGETLAIIAAGNPTAGYRWISLEDIPSEYQPDNGAIGSGGAFVFKTRIRYADKGRTLTFVYKRPWENGAPAAVCTVKIANVL